MNSLSSQTWALPTGGFNFSRFSSIHFCRLKALSELMDAILFLPRNGLVSNRFHLDQQVGMRQLMYGYGRSRRPLVVEVLAIDLVITGKVVHVDQKSRDLRQVL